MDGTDSDGYIFLYVVMAKLGGGEKKGYQGIQFPFCFNERNATLME